jgi:hypothetical protein
MTKRTKRALLHGPMSAGVLLTLPLVLQADPSPRSVATVAACAMSETTVSVCSSKELSNVILQCSDGEGSSYFFKIDDLDAAELENPYQGDFSCPDGDLIEAVFVKSGSTKSGAAPGAGQEALFGLAMCPVSCPAPSGGDGGDSNTSDDGDETPPEDTLR